MNQGQINAAVTAHRNNKQWLVIFTAKLSETEREAARNHLKTVLRIENANNKQKKPT